MPSSQESSAGLIFDLDLVSNTQVIPPESSLHVPETLHVLELIRERVVKLDDLPQLSENAAPMRNHLHEHEAILAHGPRGSGKTTLLLTVRAVIQNNHGASAWRSRLAVDEQPADWYKQVLVLPPLDPTLVEGDEVFLATVVANILRELRRTKHRHGDPDRRGAWQPDGQGSMAGEGSREVDEALTRLASALRVLAPKAAQLALNDATNDPTLFAERLISNANSGLDLAERFHAFCVAACIRLGVKALVQPIDDADVSIDQGFSVLETVRRYLSHRRILTLMLGDLDLFGVVVRDHQWKHLGKLVKVEGKVGGSETNRQVQRLVTQVADLSDQYLLKLIRVERRVQLPDATLRLQELLRTTGEVKVRWRERGTPRDVPLEQLLRAVVRRFLGEADRSEEQHEWRLLSGNTRELRGVLRWMTLFPIEDGAEDKGPDDETLIRGFQEVYAGPLGEYPEAREPLAGLRRGDLQGWQGWLMQQRDPTPFWRLDQPTEALGLRGRAAAALQIVTRASLVARWRKVPLDQLRYFGAVLSPMTAVDDPHVLEEIEGKPEEVSAELVARWRLGRGEPAWLTAARVTVTLIPRGALSATTNKVSFGCGTRLPPKTQTRRNATLWRVLNELVRPKSPQAWIGVHAWRLKLSKSPKAAKQVKKGVVLASRILPTLNSWLDEIGSGDASLVLGWFRTVPRSYNQRYDLLDPWKGLAALGDLGERLNSSGARLMKSQLDRTLTDIVRRAEAITIAVAGTATDWDAGQPEEDEEPVDPGEADQAANKDEEVGLVQAMLRWLSDGRAGATSTLLPPEAWARLAERFAENLHAIEDTLQPWEHSAGADLERWVLAFLHNLLLVETEVRGLLVYGAGRSLDPRSNIRAVNTKGELKVPFGTNLNRVASETMSADLPVFARFASCPMLVATLSQVWRVRLGSLLGYEQQGMYKESSLFGVNVDVHTALCALVPRISSSKSKSKNDQTKDREPTTPELEVLAKRFLGWQVAGVEADEDPSPQPAESGTPKVTEA